jgi:PAS domain S-box-containing protein
LIRGRPVEPFLHAYRLLGILPFGFPNQPILLAIALPRFYNEQRFSQARKLTMILELINPFDAAFATILAPALVTLAASSRNGSRKFNGDQWVAVRKISAISQESADLETTMAAALDEILGVSEMDGGAIRLAFAPIAPSLTISRGLSEMAAAAVESSQLECVAEQYLVRNQMLEMGDLERCGLAELARILKAESCRHFSLHPFWSENRAIGFLALASARPKAASQIRQPIFASLIDLLGASVAAARMRQHAAKLSEDLVALHEVNKIVSQSLDLEDIIRRIVVEGRRLVKTRQCHLFLFDDRQQRLIGSASTQEDLRIRDVEILLAEESVAARALRQKHVITVENIPGTAGFTPKVMQAMGWRAAIFAPLIAREQTIGMLICSDESMERVFTQEEISRAETLAHQAAIALENARLFQVVSRSQKEWETTFDAMQDCVSVHDTTGKIIRANVALARRVKTTPPKMIGKSCSEIYNPAQLSFSPCRHMDALQSESLLVEECEITAMGGTFQISVTPWYDKNNRLVGSIHVAKDISNEKLLRQQLIQSEKLSAIGELISGIAHELNNPLTGVMGYSQLLQLRKDLDERARDSLLKINNLALRCQKIVQNLLSFARKQKPERSLSNVNEMLERTVELRNYELSVNNIEIIRELDRNLPKTIADAHQLQQVFLNVLTNAEHAMLQAHGRGRLVIRSRADLANHNIVVEFIDDGPGIPESQLSKIFDPFFTTKEVGKGTGLGLSLSYGIIKEHGGNIHARSKPGEGATFVIELPIITRLIDEAAVFPQLMPQALQFEHLIRGKRILIVDDEKYILDFFGEIFKMYPIQVDTAGDGRKAMEKLQERDYDLVITDFKMPHMSGRELFHWIKDKRPHLTRRIIFITGDTVSAETRLFFENNSNLYLAKPFKIEEVKEVIQQTLEGGDR